MKKLVALVLALVMVMGMTAWAEDFDVTKYSKEELMGIMNAVYNLLPKANKGTPVYDAEDFYAEYRGIAAHDKKSIDLGLYIENRSKNDVYVRLETVAINGEQIDTVWNNGILLGAGLGWTMRSCSSMFIGGEKDWELFDTTSPIKRITAIFAIHEPKEKYGYLTNGDLIKTIRIDFMVEDTPFPLKF